MYHMEYRKSRFRRQTGRNVGYYFPFETAFVNQVTKMFNIGPQLL